MSVIVPAKNSALTLAYCLDSIQNQTYPNIELIVVDNSSSDETASIAITHGATLLHKGPERSAQVNFGVQRSHGKYVYRVDSDMIVGSDVVAQAVDVCENSPRDGVIIRSISDARISYWSKVRSYERLNLYQHDHNVAVRFLSRTSFDTIGGFDESLSGFEDYDLHDRFIAAGFKFGRISSNEVHVGEPTTMSEIVRKHVYYGRYLSRYLRKSKSNLKRVSPLRAGQLSMLARMKGDPDLLIGFVVYQYVRYLSTFIGMFSSR